MHVSIFIVCRALGLDAAFNLPEDGEAEQPNPSSSPFARLMDGEGEIVFTFRDSSTVIMQTEWSFLEKKTLQTVLLSSSTISFKFFPVFRLECLHDFDQIDTFFIAF